MVLVVGFAATAVVAFAASQQAVRQRDVARSGQLINESEATTDPTISKLESITAWHLHHSNDARYAMLAAAASPGIATLTGHTDRVHSVAFSLDGQMLASGSFDDTVRLWNVATQQQIGNPLTGYSVAFSHDGKTLASGSYDHTVRLWDVASLTGIATLTGHTYPVLSVAFSPDGKTLASGSRDDTVRLWDMATHRQIGSPLTSHTGWVLSVAFSQTARPWPAAAPMARCGCGMWPPAARLGTPSGPAPARSSRWPSARTARPSPAAAFMTRCSCGMSPTSCTPSHICAPLQNGPSHAVSGRNTEKLAPEGPSHQSQDHHLKAGAGQHAHRLPSPVPGED